MAKHYHVLNSETGDDYSKHWDEEREIEYSPTLADARKALADAKWGYEAPDTWILGSLDEGVIYVYDRRHYPRRKDCNDLGYEVMVSICQCGVPGVEGMCDE